MILMAIPLIKIKYYAWERLLNKILTFSLIQKLVSYIELSHLFVSYDVF